MGVHQTHAVIPMRLLNLSDSDVTIQKRAVIVSRHAVDTVIQDGDGEAMGTHIQREQVRPQTKESTWPDVASRLYQISSSGLMNTGQEKLHELLANV